MWMIIMWNNCKETPLTNKTVNSHHRDWGGLTWKKVNSVAKFSKKNMLPDLFKQDYYLSV